MKMINSWSSCCGSVVIKSNWEPQGCRFDPWPCSVGWGTSVAMSCAVGHRCSSDPSLLCLWRRPAATAPIRPLAWEPPNTAGAALEKAKRQNKKKKKEKKKRLILPENNCNFKKLLGK